MSDKLEVLLRATNADNSRSFQSAIEYGSDALVALERRLREPVSYEEKRAAAVLSLHTGQAPQQPSTPHRPRSEADVKADNLIKWKALIRIARGQVGMAKEDFESTNVEQNDDDVEAGIEEARSG